MNPPRDQIVPPGRVAEMSVHELKERLDQGEALSVLDVREPDERACSLHLPPNARDLHIPLGNLPQRLDEIRDATRAGRVVVYCHLGVRSQHAATWLANQGIDVINLRGGIDAWSVRIDPTVPRY
jgi:rhodanese-related sulfurtransferase